MNKTSEAQIKSVRKWEKQNLDRGYFQIRKDHNYKERIKKTGFSINGFIVEAILEKLEKEEAAK